MRVKGGLFQIGDNPVWVLWTLAFAALLFVPYLWAMISLPGIAERACLVGASLTPGNVLFSGVMSVMSAWMIFGLWLLHKQRAFKFRIAAGGAITGLAGFFTVFCTLCTLPVLSVFGLSFGLGFFTAYHAMFKAISLSLMAFVLWLLNHKLRNCEVCG